MNLNTLKLFTLVCFSSHCIAQNEYTNFTLQLNSKITIEIVHTADSTFNVSIKNIDKAPLYYLDYNLKGQDELSIFKKDSVRYIKFGNYIDELSDRDFFYLKRLKKNEFTIKKIIISNTDWNSFLFFLDLAFIKSSQVLVENNETYKIHKSEYYNQLQKSSIQINKIVN